MSWLEDGNVDLEQSLHTWIAVGLSYCKRFLFKDREVVFPSGVDVVPVVDEGSSTSVLSCWGERKTGCVANELEDVGEVRDLDSITSGCPLGVFDPNNEHGNIDFRTCCRLVTGIEESTHSDVSEEDFVANSLVTGSACDDARREGDFGINRDDWIGFK